MPTEVLSHIRASGGDYTTLSAWEAGEQRNLVTADEIATAVCYNDWPSGLNDSVNISGWTTDATHYIRVTVAGGHRHNGTPGSGFHLRQATSGSSLFLVQHAGTRIEWVDGAQQSTASSKYCFRAFGSAATGVIFDRCLGRNQSSTSANAVFMADSSDSSESRQCLAYSSITGFGTSGAKSCIAVGCTTGFGGAGSRDPYNCVAYNCTTDYSTAWGYGGLGSNNASSGTGATAASPEGGGINSVTSAAFVDAANNDFHISAGSVLRGAGVNLYSDFTTDIDGDTWPSSGAWDIGFDYYVAAGAPVTVEPVAGRASARGYAPTLAQPITLAPLAGRATATGYAPTLTQPRTIAPTKGAAQARGYAPTIEHSAAQTIAPASGRAESRGYAPALSQPITITPAAGRAIARGYAPEISQASSIRPEAGRALASGYAPTIGQSRTIAAQAGRAQASGHAPIIVQGVPIVIDPQTGRVSARGYAPGVVQGGAVTVSPAAGRAAARGYAPGLVLPIADATDAPLPMGRILGASLSMSRPATTPLPTRLA